MNDTWQRLGAPSGGAVTGVVASPAFADDRSVFAATMAGLFRSSDAGQSWHRVGGGPKGLSLTTVAVSPDFARDRLILVASLEGGLLRVSADDGPWASGDFQGAQVDIAALAMSPNFARDGVVFAATMATGVCLSRNRGATWEPSTFGLLDLDVSALALSPAFERDETLFAATATGVFRSPNGGRAWREVGFPETASPAQCLAISPAFSVDGTLFAGTDAAGLFRSSDRGATWQPAGAALGDACINAIVLSPRFADDRTILIATEAAVYVSRDAGESWALCAEAPGALCLAVTPTFPGSGPAFVGLSHEGILRSGGDVAHWQQANTGLSGHRLSGLALSPTLTQDRRVVAFGAEAGIVRSDDGGSTWVEVGEGLPLLELRDVALCARPGGDLRIVAALAEGIWACPWDEDTWTRIGDLAARLLVTPPRDDLDGGLLAVAVDGGVWIADGTPWRWTPVSVPWAHGEVLALATSPSFARDRRAFAAVQEQGGARIQLWQGAIPGGWQPVAAYESPYRHAALAVPAALPWDGTWYAAIGDQFYGPLGRSRDARGVERFPAGYTLTAERPAIIALAALPGPSPSGVLAATSRGLYSLADGSREWHALGDQQAPHSIVTIAPAPPGDDATVYALGMGGQLYRGHLSMG